MPSRWVDPHGPVRVSFMVWQQVGFGL